MHVRKGGREGGRAGEREREREREDAIELMIIAPKVFSHIVEENRTVYLYLPVSQKQLMHLQL
jgi:hypothetical protein